MDDNTNKPKVNLFFTVCYFVFIIILFNILNYHAMDISLYILLIFSAAELYLLYIPRKNSILYIASVLSMSSLIFLFFIYFV